MTICKEKAKSKVGMLFLAFVFITSITFSIDLSILGNELKAYGVYLPSNDNISMCSYHNLSLLSFEESGLIYGIAVFDPSEKHIRSEFYIKFAEKLSLRALALQAVENDFTAKDYPGFLKNDFLNFQLEKNISISVERMIEKRRLEGKYLGYYVLVRIEDCNVKLFDPNAYSFLLLENLEQILYKINNTKEQKDLLDHYYRLVHSETFNDRHKMIVSLYYIDFYLERGERKKAQNLYSKLNKTVDIAEEVGQLDKKDYNLFLEINNQLKE